MKNEDSIGQDDRRNRQRFSLNIPLTVFIGDRAIATFTRDISDRGVYFYLDLSDSEMIGPDFELMLKLPPEVTFSPWCSVKCQARLVRKDSTPRDSVGIGAEILQYSIIRDAVPSA